MRRALALRLGAVSFACGALWQWPMYAQEANSGVDLRATLSVAGAASNVLTESPRDGLPVSAGFRGVFYPTWKISEHWVISGAYQVYSYPYFSDSFSMTDYGVSGTILQGSLGYSRVSKKGSVLVRAGVLSTAFGSFSLRYDDNDNALIEPPLGYGYYAVTSTLGLLSAQVDATRGKWDGRAQFANSSPANPRSVFAKDQYGNWAGGGGYTIRQGFRVGVSGYRGPFLDRQSSYFLPGEESPSKLPARAGGVDAAWAHGHWNVQGEWQTFVLPYTKLPTYRGRAEYAEVKRVLTPRWYLAGRVGATTAKETGNTERFEATVGFRPDRFQLIKAGYEVEHHGTGTASDGTETHAYDNSFVVQFVTVLHR
jgi:hypothetical protein